MEIEQSDSEDEEKTEEWEKEEKEVKEVKEPVKGPVKGPVKTGEGQKEKEIAPQSEKTVPVVCPSRCIVIRELIRARLR